MKKEEKKGNRKGMFIFLCILIFIISFGVGVVFKITYDPTHGKYIVKNFDEIGKKYTDIDYESEYGLKSYHKFDLYVPNDNSKENYGLIVYLHPGGFTTGDKEGDNETLKYYSSLGYVTAGINYTLRTDDTPDASVYTQTMEIKDSMQYVVDKAKELGYNIDEMTIGGGSAGGCLALIYAYRDAESSPVPVRMVFEGVGPSSFYPEDWTNYGFDKDDEETKKAAAGLFSVMAGKEITPDMFGTEEYDEITKDISALYWINENTVPSVLAYGKHDTVQPYLASVRLDEKLTKYGIDHKYFVMEHSGHGLQNDTKKSIEYQEAILEYLNKYMPVK